MPLSLFRGWDLGQECLLAGVRALEAERRKPNFGNAGAVNNLLSAASERMESRLSALSPKLRAEELPIPADFLPLKPSNAGIFDDLIGCK
jgi:hypothetical protein